MVPTEEPSGFAGFLQTYQALLPAPLLVLILYVVYRFFRSTWRELDLDAQESRAAILAEGKSDLRPFVALCLAAFILTVQYSYGDSVYFRSTVYPWLSRLDARHPGMKLVAYADLYNLAWWGFSRVFGYTLPFMVWRLFFPKDSLLDLGLRARGFFAHAWIYMLFFAVVVPAMLVVANNPDFGSYYPFYKDASRSWFDFLVWEVIYFAQFFALEMFFRGFFLGALRKSFGSGAIFVMAVPYCMIHYGKPYLEACGAIIAGVALGSLSMKTRSIYQGFLVHVTVAGMMDWLALRNRKATPLAFWRETRLEMPTDGDPALREALAIKVEIVAAVFFVALFGLLAVNLWRDWKRRRGQGAPLPEPSL